MVTNAEIYRNYRTGCGCIFSVKMGRAAGLEVYSKAAAVREMLLHTHINGEIGVGRVCFTLSVTC